MQARKRAPAAPQTLRRRWLCLSDPHAMKGSRWPAFLGADVFCRQPGPRPARGG